MKEKIKRFFIKESDNVNDELVEEKDNMMSSFEVENETPAEKVTAGEKGGTDDKPVSDYTLKEIAEMKDNFDGDDMLYDILSEEFAVFSQSRSGSLAEKYEAFAKLKALMKPKTENKREETVAEKESRLHSGFSGGGYRDVSTGLTKRQMDMARSAGMSFKEYEELLISAPAGRKNRF